MDAPRPKPPSARAAMAMAKAQAYQDAADAPATGSKTLVVASTHGNQRTTVEIDGKPVTGK